MDMQYSNYWMQGLQPPQGHGQQSQPDALEHDAQRAAADWPKDAPSSDGNGTSQQPSHPPPPALDLSDFGLADFNGEQPRQPSPCDVATPARKLKQFPF